VALVYRSYASTGSVAAADHHSHNILLPGCVVHTCQVNTATVLTSLHKYFNY
jgi:hypothetical protein